MQYDFPKDADGDALRRLIESGSDLSKPMLIDFQVDVPDETVAGALAEAMRQLGYHVKIYASSGNLPPWVCECSTRMIATYHSVIAVQEELASLAIPFGGHPDGWGSFGNGTRSAG